MLLRSNIGIRRDFELPGHPNQIGQRARAHFAHDAAAVRFDGQVSGAQFAGDLLVQQAGNNQRQDLTLARSQCLEAGLQFQRSPIAACGPGRRGAKPP